MVTIVQFPALPHGGSDGHCHEIPLSCNTPPHHTGALTITTTQYSAGM